MSAEQPQSAESTELPHGSNLGDEQGTKTCRHRCWHLNADGLGMGERINGGLSNYVAHKFPSNKLIAGRTDEAWIMRRIRTSVGIVSRVNIELIL